MQVPKQGKTKLSTSSQSSPSSRIPFPHTTDEADVQSGLQAPPFGAGAEASQSYEYPAESAVYWKIPSPHFDAKTHVAEQV